MTNLNHQNSPCRGNPVIDFFKQFFTKDKESWMKVCEKVSEKCLVVGNTVYQRPGLLKQEVITEEFCTSAISLKFEQMTTITDLIHVAKKMERKWR